jgi:protein-S-isoprenylcysteine O-methyltransferase Ste14
MDPLALAGQAVFAVYLAGFLLLTRRLARASGADPWLFGRASGVQRSTALAFRLGFALLVALPLIRLIVPRTPEAVATWPAALGWLGLLLAIAGAGLALRAQAHMGASWRIGAAEGRLGQLVTDGPFAWSRNPVFLGQIVLVWGVALGGDPIAAVLALVVTAAAVSQVAVEERVIAAGLGPEYAAYRARVNRWLGRKRVGRAG